MDSFPFPAFLVALKRGKTKPLQWPSPEQGIESSVGKAIGDLMKARGWREADAWQDRANTAAPTIVGGSHKHGGPDLGPTRARKEWAELGVDGLGLADDAPAEDFTGMPRLTVPMVAGHIVDKSLGGKDELANLRSLCSTCNQGAKNITTERPSGIWLLAQIRRAGQDEQKAALDWLRKKFGS